jgi:hypothetical protein
MTAPANLTDLQVLRILLSLPHETLKERRPFQAMYEDLATGRQVKLTKKQRAWVDQIYFKHELDRRSVPLKKMTIRDKAKPILDFGPLPKKPPGR